MASQAALRAHSNYRPAHALPLYTDGQPDQTRIADFIGFSRQKSKNTTRSLAASSAAPIPQVIQKKAKAIAEICELVAQDFNGDKKKHPRGFVIKALG